MIGKGETTFGLGGLSSWHHYFGYFLNFESFLFGFSFCSFQSEEMIIGEEREREKTRDEKRKTVFTSR